jgi:hypothetical protein
MPRLLKKLACLALLAVSVLTGERARAFALLGPFNEAYQVIVIGYQTPGDIGAPKNLGEEYRHNMPIMYYSFDANFLDYFGSNGVAAVDSAIAILNNLTNVSSFSHDLNEFPLQATRENYLAEALGLADVKTHALKSMVEQMGLAEPERYVWTLNDRAQIPNSPPCPAGYVYQVIMRNFDPVPTSLNQFQASPYVNGTLYSYFVTEACTGPATLAVTLPFPVDPLDFTFTAVASITGVGAGQFHTGLTRDDAGGLRYLISPQRFNFESSGTNSQAVVTNPIPQLLFTSNLTLFASQALTNDPVTLGTLYPTINIINSSNYFVNGFTTNVTTYFTNYPWDPVGTVPHAKTATNLVPTVFTRFNHVFGNLFLLSQTSTGSTLVQTTEIPPATNHAFVTSQTDKIGNGNGGFSTGGGATNITTNTTLSTSLVSGVVAGDYFILPTNICGVQLVQDQLAYVTTTTNLLSSVTNSTSVTNAVGVTNAGTFLIVNQYAINYFTNHVFVALEANCVPGGAALFGGVDRFTFVRRDFDSLLGRFFATITNNYVLNSLTNNTVVPEPIQRTVSNPDFLFSARDLSSGQTGASVYPPIGGGILSRDINFNQSLKSLVLAGPGTIDPSTTISFNKVGPEFLNFAPSAFSPGTSQAGAGGYVNLGSFDASTNAPIVYPNGTSIGNLENAALIGISPLSLPGGTVGVAYRANSPTFIATGGQAPYVWSLAPGSPGLPPGLFLLPDGTLGGTPTQDGTFDFTVLVTDAGGRSVERPYSITIMP